MQRAGFFCLLPTSSLLLLAACLGGAPSTASETMASPVAPAPPNAPQTQESESSPSTTGLVLVPPEARNPFMRQREAGALLAAELQEVQSAATNVGVETGYYRNGCQSRAHAAWLSLPRHIQTRVGKIWIFQPSLHSYFRRREAILTKLDSGVRWDYHVALVFDTPSDGEQVLDMALGANWMSIDDWLAQFTVPDESLLVTTAGDYYAYFSAGGVMTGFHDYSGLSCEQKWIPGDLAFEKVGKALLEDPTACPSLNEYAESSIKGKAELEHHDFESRHAGTRCQELRDVYLRESKRVLELLPGWAIPDSGGLCRVPPRS